MLTTLILLEVLASMLTVFFPHREISKISGSLYFGIVDSVGTTKGQTHYRVHYMEVVNEFGHSLTFSKTLLLVILPKLTVLM